MQFTIEVKFDIMILFVGVLVITKGMVLTKAYWKPTHTGLYLSFEYLYQPQVKRVVQNLHTELLHIQYANKQDMFNLVYVCVYVYIHTRAHPRTCSV